MQQYLTKFLLAHFPNNRCSLNGINNKIESYYSRICLQWYKSTCVIFMLSVVHTEIQLICFIYWLHYSLILKYFHPLFYLITHTQQQVATNHPHPPLCSEDQSVSPLYCDRSCERCGMPWANFCNSVCDGIPSNYIFKSNYVVFLVLLASVW